MTSENATSTSSFWPIVHTLQTSVGTLIALIGLIGNGCVTYVYGKKHTLSPTEKLIISISVVDLMSCMYFLVFPVLKAVYDQFLPLEPCLVDQFILWFIPLVSLFLMATICLNRLTAVCFPIQYPQFFSVRNVRYVLIGSVLYSASTGLSFSLLCFYYHATFQNWENEERFWMLVNRVATLHVITLYSLSILGIVISSLITAASLRRRMKSKNRNLKAGFNSCQGQSMKPLCNSKNSECYTEIPKSPHRGTLKTHEGTEDNDDMVAGTSSNLNMIGQVDENNQPITKPNGNASTRVTPKDVKLTKALLIVATAYVILCTPYITYHLLFRIYIDLDSFSPTKQFLVKITVTTLYIINYTINPFTYYYLNEFFHAEVTELFRKLFRCSGNNSAAAKCPEEHDETQNDKRRLSVDVGNANGATDNYYLTSGTEVHAFSTVANDSMI